MKVGVISDTHGLLRPEALQHLEGSDLILHAGDLGSPELLDQLAGLAPLKAVRGNVDRGPWAEQVPVTEALEVGGKWIYMIHILGDLDIDPAAAEMDLVIFGHSHKPEKFEKDGVVYLNPGSIGPRRFSLPISMALLEIEEDRMDIQFLNLEN